MTYTFDQSKDEIARLVKHFSTNQTAFMAPGYKEAHARQEFIDPLFIALNWDVHNQQQAAPDYREVIVEDSIEMAGHEARKAPDYVFRIGRERKFFAEAKKPGVDLKTAAGPAYQLRRYAWSAKLPLSVLTDFHEWVAYDCRIRPAEGDKTSTARLAYMTYVEYADRWREIWDVFSREAVWGGSFDKYAQGGKGRRGTSEVDAEFLKEIEGWRDSLARNIALRNPDLTLEEMNDAVQRTIDRIIFLRMVEARGMEEYGQLQKTGESENIYANLLVLSIRADAKYNSGLFDFSKTGDQVTPRLTVDDKILKPILADLYYPQSPYEFSVLPVEILGNVYEQFLGKVIHLTDAHHAKVEEKPEVKKAGGVYYTPAYIVEYIVKNTVGKQIEGKSPAQLKGFRVLDPACGSGSFLLGAYSYLLDYYHNWYGSHEPGKKKEAVAQQADGSWQLILQERKRILTEHIFGVDIDRQAMEVTKLSLLLKVLEGVKQLTLLNERALPNLDNNIKCGNSLIGPDYFAGQMMPDTDELRRVNPFDWKKGFPEAMQAGGFDCVIGNPPYGTYFYNADKSYLTNHFTHQNYQLDSYLLFLEDSLINLLRSDGHYGMIIPNPWLTNLLQQNLRSFVLKTSCVEQIVHFTFPVFSKVTVDTEIIILRKNNPISNTVLINVIKKSSDLLQIPIIAEQLRHNQEKWIALNGGVINIFTTDEEEAIAKKCLNIGPSLEDHYDINVGIKPYQKGKGKPPQTKAVVDDRPFDSDRPLNRLYRAYLRGSDINRYAIEPLKPRFIKYGTWLAEPRPAANFNAPIKIFIRQTGDSLIATIDVDKYLCLNNMHVLVPKTEIPSPKYILGILNSRLLNWFYQTLNPEVGEALAEVKKTNVARLPIRVININDPFEKTQYDKIILNVEQMLDLHKHKAKAKEGVDQERLQRLIDSTDQQIDALVYELYGLTPDEIAIVEGAAKG